VGVELEHSLCGLRDLAAALGGCPDCVPVRGR
jgi:hypothetical protein